MFVQNTSGVVDAVDVLTPNTVKTIERTLNEIQDSSEHDVPLALLCAPSEPETSSKVRSLEVFLFFINLCENLFQLGLRL